MRRKGNIIGGITGGSFVLMFMVLMGASGQLDLKEIKQAIENNTTIDRYDRNIVIYSGQTNISPIPTDQTSDSTVTYTSWMDIGQRMKYGFGELQIGLFTEADTDTDSVFVSVLGQFGTGDQPYILDLPLVSIYDYNAESHPSMVPFQTDNTWYITDYSTTTVPGQKVIANKLRLVFSWYDTSYCQSSGFGRLNAENALVTWSVIVADSIETR